jgi:hypothetical protein
LQLHLQNLEELLGLLLQQLRRLRQDGQRLEEDEFVRRQLLTFLPEMQARLQLLQNSRRHYLFIISVQSSFLKFTFKLLFYKFTFKLFKGFSF